MNPDQNANVLDAPEAFRASPDADTKDERMDLDKMFGKEKDDSVPSLVDNTDSDTPLSELSDIESLAKATAPPAKASKEDGKRKAAKASADGKPAAPAKAKKPDAKEPQFLDPEAEGEEEPDEEEIKAALARPPPVNSDILPLPWKGRLGYVSYYSSFRSRTHPDDLGMPEHIPSLLESTRFQLSNLPYSLHPRKSPSSQQSKRTSTRDQEPPGQRPTIQRPKRSRIC